MKFFGQTVLIFSPHQDDEVIGCGGIIQKFLSEGSNVHVSFGTAVDGLYDRYNREMRLYEKYHGNERMKEMYDCLKILGINEQNISFLYESKYHSKLDQIPFTEFLEKVENEILRINPTIILIPAVSSNQDHERINRVLISAMRPNFYSKNIMEYEIANELNFKPNFYVKLSKNQLYNKIEALGCYNTQYRGEINKISKEGIYNRAVYRGSDIHCKYAEAFQVKRLNWD